MVSFPRTWDSWTIRSLIRGRNPWPGAFSHLDGKMLKIWDAKALSEKELSEAGSSFDSAKLSAAENGSVVAVTKDSFIVKTGEGYLKILELQLEGKKRMKAKDFLLGYKLSEGTILGK